MNENRMFVTTDCDLWNSADEAHFFVVKGQVKELPEVTTPIIEDALTQGLLREATEEQISKQLFDNDVEQAIIRKAIKPGKNYAETVKSYQEYKAAEEKIAKPEELVVDPESVVNDDKEPDLEEPEEEVEEKTEEVVN